MALVFKIDFGTGFKVIEPPKNWKATKLELIWTSEFPSATVQSINYEFTGQNAIDINKYIADGIAGGQGIGEGPGFQIYEGATLIFDGCLDLVSQNTLIECDKIVCSILETGRIDWLTNISYLTFSYLKDIGKITSADYKKTPYTITTIPDGPQLTMLILSEFIMVQELLKEISEITNFGTQDAGAATTEVTTLGTTSGDLVADIAETVAEVIYCGILLVSIVSVAIQIFNQIVQTKKYKYCMRVEDLFNKACQEIGVTFSSSIFQQGKYKDATIMPKKIIMPKTNQSILSAFDRSANEVNDSLAYGHYEGSFKKLMQELSLTFNAAPKLDNNILYFEEIHAYNKPGVFQLPNEGPVGYTYNYPAPHGTNFHEFESTTEFKFQADASERNTMQRYRGTSAQVTIQPNIVNNQKNLMLRGVRIIDFPFALAKRKEYLDFVEQALQHMLNAIAAVANVVISIVNTILNIINTIISWFGGSSTTIPTIPYIPTNIMNGRIGWMELSGDTFDIQKLFIGTNSGGDWLISPNNENDMSAISLLTDFHGKNLPTRQNQWLTFKNKKFKLCTSDFLLIKGNNIFTTADNKLGKFERIIWNLYTGEAEADYRVNEEYTKNLKETVTVDGN